MKRERVWMLGSFLIILVVLGGGYTLGIAPILAQADASDAGLIGAEAQANANQATLNALKQKYANIDALKADLAEARLAIPQEKDVSEFVAGLDDLAISEDVVVTDVTVAEPLPYVRPVGPAAETPATPAEGTATTAEGAAPATTEPVVSSTSAIPHAELITKQNMSIIPITISISGAANQNMSFVKDLQTGKRIYLVTRITTTFDESAMSYRTVIEGYVYVVLDAAAAAAAPQTVAGG